MRPRRQPPGFTLIELLVIVAIILALAGIVLGAVPQVLKTARRTVCLSNLKQVGTALQMYADEHNQFLPSPLYTGQGFTYSSASGNSLAKALAPYLSLPEPTSDPRNVEVLQCPGYSASVHASDGKPYSVVNSITLENGKVIRPFGYPANAEQGKPAAPAVPLSQIPQPAAQYALRDTESDSHGKSQNRLFFDWHVENVLIP